MTSITSQAGSGSPYDLPVRPFWATDLDRWGVPVQLGQRRVLHRGRWRWLRAMAWLVLVFFLTAAAFGLLLQAAEDRPLRRPTAPLMTSPTADAALRKPAAALRRKVLKQFRRPSEWRETAIG